MMVRIFSHVDDLAYAAEVSSRWDRIARDDDVWRSVANELGYIPSPDTPPFQQVMKHIQELRKEIKDRGNLPAYVEELLTQRITIENIKRLIALKKAIDTLVFWDELAHEIFGTPLFGTPLKNHADLSNYASIRDIIVQANRLDEWIEENHDSLQKVRIFLLSGDKLAHLPEGIGMLPNLEILELDSNNITHVPKGIGMLQKLFDLDLSKNNLTEVPNWITQLKNLKFLDLSNNKITEIPSWIAQLQKLRGLNLSNNNFSEIPGDLIEQLKENGVHVQL